MDVDFANGKHIEYISSSLSEYFKEINARYGFPKFRDDYDLMLKHVSKRIESEDKDFIYLVAEQNESPVGFINLLVDENGNGSILAIKGNKEETKRLLLERAITYFKENGIKKIHGEIVSYDTESRGILESLGMEEIILSFSIKI